MISMMNTDLKKSAPLEITIEGVCAGACGRRKTVSPCCINCKMPLPTGPVIFGVLAVGYYKLSGFLQASQLRIIYDVFSMNKCLPCSLQ